MRNFDHRWLMAGVAKEMRRQALTSGFYDGTQRTFACLEKCRGYHIPTGTLMIFSRDSGMHSCGWWKNPDYERCWHLSLSFRDPETGELDDKNAKLTHEWIDLFYGDNKRLIWTEPPYYKEGKQNDTWHYRLFCDEYWQPIQPRGEVYSKQFTEIGWKSYSEVRDAELMAIAAAGLSDMGGI